jgi:XTP/dITP diphosphohydrolase
MPSTSLPRRLVVATTNCGKLQELKSLLGPHGVAVVSVATLLPGWSVEETGTTFAENARLKAVDVARRLREPALADDSGLEVAALGGAPGVRSARYASEHATDADNVAELLAALRDVADDRRQAAFRCALALAWPGGALLEVDGRCEGTIAREPRGTSGFGYDPVFVDPASGKTFAELDEVEKSARSHRGRALVALCERLGVPVTRTAP